MNFFQRTPSILFITLITILFIFSLRRTASKSIVSQENVEVLEHTLQDITTKIEIEKKELEYTSSEFAKEGILRNELLLQKPGEYILQIPLEEKEIEKQKLSQEKTPWETWKNLLLNKKVN